MRFRKLRIAFSVVCGVLCLLLIAMWVRSNWYVDGFWFPTPFGCGIGFISVENCASLTLEQGILDADYMHVENYDVNQHSNLRPATHFGFLFAREPSSMYGYVPYWFLVGIVATAPWLHWRFSLRALLITTALVAAVLGIFVAVSR